MILKILGTIGKTLIEKVRKILNSRSLILFAYIFGSQVMGEATMRSDGDVAIYTSKSMSWKEIIEVQNQLEDNINRKVDLIYLNTAPLLLAYEVISKGKLILDRDPASRVEYEVKVLREFLDIRPRLEEYYRLVLHMES